MSTSFPVALVLLTCTLGVLTAFFVFMFELLLDAARIRKTNNDKPAYVILTAGYICFAIGVLFAIGTGCGLIDIAHIIGDPTILSKLTP